jgi:hypothetical protein
MNLEIVPHCGAEPFRFGVPEAVVETHLGPPKFRSKRPFPPGTIELEYPGLAFAFDSTGRLAQIGFDKHFHGQLILNGVDLFQDPDALRKLVKMDGDAHLWVGFVMLMGLGVRLGGFHEVADEGRTVSVFERARYDAKRPRFTPFNPDSSPSTPRG